MTIKMNRLMLVLALVFLMPLFALANGEKGGEGEEVPLKIRYKLGKGLSFSDDDFSLTLSAFVQPRFTYTSLETAPDTNTFAIQRGKILLNGFVLDPQWQYGFMMDISTPTGGTAVLNDYFIDWVPRDYFGIKVGQFKVPFLMQEVTADTKQQMADRSLVNGIFTLIRDIGVTFHGSLWDKKFHYHTFVMNGAGANTINTNQGLMGGARLEYHILGTYDRSEPDIEDSQEPQLGMGVAYVFHDALNSTGTQGQGGTVPVGTKSSLGTIDAGYKYKGFSLNGMAVLTRAHEAADLTNWGYNLQAGYFIVPKHFEVAVKGGGAVFSDAVANQYEYGAGLNYYVKGHPLKFQTDYALLMNPRGLNLNDHRIRTQFQLIF